MGSFVITITMEMTSSRLMAIIAILAALTFTQVEACTGEPCNIGNPNMCRLERETDRTGAMPTHRSLLGEPMPAAHRRLAATSSRRRLARYKGNNGIWYATQKEAADSYKKKSGKNKESEISGISKENGGYV